MKAIRLHQYGGPENLRYDEDVSEPDCAADQVLVDVWATSVNPIDWKVRSGARQKDFPMALPGILGKDVSGVVRAVGADIRTFRVGDRVLGMADATYAERTAVKGTDLAHLPHGVDAVDAAALPLVALTGDQLVREITKVQPGQTVLVSGALGSVGRTAVHVAKKLGARVIAGVRARQLDEAAALGAAGTVALDDEAALRRLGPVDGVVDTVGGDVAARLFELIRDGGRFGYASVLPADVPARYPGVTVGRVFARPDAATVRAFADDVRDGRFHLPIARRLPLREAAEAHALAERGGAGKIVHVVRE